MYLTNLFVCFIEVVDDLCSLREVVRDCVLSCVDLQDRQRKLQDTGYKRCKEKERKLVLANQYHDKVYNLLLSIFCCAAYFEHKLVP